MEVQMTQRTVELNAAVEQLQLEVAERRRAEEALRESEERFRAIFSQAAVGIAQTSPQGELLLLNNRFSEIVGYTQAELRGKTFADITHPDDRGASIAARDQFLAGEISSGSTEKRYIQKNGATVWARLHVSLVRDQHHAPQYFIVVVEDITDRIQAEQALRESEQRLLLALSAGVGVWDIDLRTNAPVLSPQYRRVFGQPPLTPTEWFKMVHSDDRERLIALVRESIRRRTDWDAEFRLHGPDGSVRWMLTKGTVLLGEDGRPARMLGVSLDITDRKRTEEALRVTQQRFELAQGAGGIGIWDWDATTNESHCSSGHNALYGLPPSDSAPAFEDWLELIHPEDRARMREELSGLLECADHFVTEFRVVWPDGSIHWLYGKGQVFRDSGGNPIRMIGVNMDISERKRAEAALRESEERFRIVADTAPVMICASGPDKLATFLNTGWLSFTGRTMAQELGYGWTEGVHPDDVDDCLASYTASFDARRNCHIEYRLRRADGEYRSVVCDGVPRFAPDGVFAGYIASCIDITDLKRQQEEDLSRQKLESLGTLAGGIAHDFNNLLGSILSQAELASAELAEGTAPEAEIANIHAVAIRGAEIVRQLMVFAGQEADTLELVDVSWLVEETIDLLKLVVSKPAVLRPRLSTDVPAVRANPATLRQILINLVTNASEAMGGQGGEIQLTTARVNVEDASLRALPAGDYLQIEVSDTGCGMAPETQAKIFDPFFTTKSPGRGLGLPVVRGIVKRLGGEITVRSQPNHGTTFRVLLPDAGKTPAESLHPIAAEKNARVARGTVLIVEDEEVMRIAVSRMLQKQGSTVLEAADGFDAVEILRNQMNDITVMLLDVTLPGLASQEVLREARLIRPDLRVIVTSAYSQTKVAAMFAGFGSLPFLRKPYRQADIMGLLG